MTPRASTIALSAILAACGDNSHPPPIDVVDGRLTARIWAAPAQIALLIDGTEVWSTTAGSSVAAGQPPFGFAAVGTIAATVETHFGSFKFTEDPHAIGWRGIDGLGDITPVAGGATFTLWAGDSRVGGGTVVFDDATRSGSDPTAAGFPRRVEITLTTDAGDRMSLATPCPADEHLVGMGGMSFDVDERGLTVPLWVQEDGIGKDPTDDDDYSGVWFLSGRRHSTHTPMPMLVSSRGYALAVDTDARAIFALGSEGADVARFEAWQPTLDLSVFIGEGPRDGDVAGAAARDALGNLIAWVGKPPRPPSTVFAPWVDAIMGSASVRQVAARLRSEGISSSVIWTEDWRGGADSSTGYALTEDWQVDRGLYPDVEQLADDLHGLGFAFLVYNNTFLDSTGDVFADATGAGYSIHDQTGAPYLFTDGLFNPGSMVDLTNPAAATWARGVMSGGIELGADGWMADFGEWLPTDAVLASGEDALAVHNRYPVDWARFNQQLLATPPTGRPAPLYFMRSAWLHSQPLVQVMWPGDQQTDWSTGDGFPSVVPMGIGLGLTGFPYFGSDIAGYMSQGTVPTSEELFYRWVTLGALSPVMRTHHGRSAEQNFQWQHDDDSVAHFRRWARFHMQLEPYLSGSLASFDRDGLPLFRLIALDYPDEPWAWSVLDEYELGDRILVAPIQVMGATSRVVQLPAGSWYPLLGGTAQQGSPTVGAPMTEIPAFVPGGTLLVLYPDGVDTLLDAPQAAGATTSANVGDDREVWLWPGTAARPEIATWHDELGPTGVPQWTWTGRADTAPPPSTATFNGLPTALTVGAGYVELAVTGDGILVLDTGGTLAIARGFATANVTVRIWTP